MNHKQKLGYMALGAGILALGIIIGQIITPDIEAQGNGVFDDITCRRLTVVDQNEKVAILLASDKESANAIVILDQNGKKAIGLTALNNEVGNAITILDQNEKMAIALSSFSDENGGNAVMVRDTLTGEFETLD